MKKFFCIFGIIFLLAFALLLTSIHFLSFDKTFARIIQRFDNAHLSNSLVLLSIDDASIKKMGGLFPKSDDLSQCLLLARELGTKKCSFDLDYKSPVENFESHIEKTASEKKKEKSFFNIKVIIPGKKYFLNDSKSPEISGKLFQFNDYPFSSSVFSASQLNSPSFFRHLFIKNNDVYYADKVFADLMDYLNVKSLKVTGAWISYDLEFKSENGDSILKNVKIPRSCDGSLLLKYPREKYAEYKSISCLELLNALSLEKNFYSYLSVMNDRGFFGEMETENPLQIYKKALSAKDNLPEYINLKNRFFRIMRAYLSGKYERLLCEAFSSEIGKESVTDTFTTCRRLFSQLESCRVSLSEKLNGSFCLFALTGTSSADFISSPMEKNYPKACESYVLANMILTNDFINYLQPLIFISFLTLTLLLSLLLTFVTSIFQKKNQRKSLLTQLSQPIPPDFGKKLSRKRLLPALEGQKSRATLLSLSIKNFPQIRIYFNENQLLAFLNYYFDKVAAVITKAGGFIESYRNDEVIAIFGLPDEKKDSSSLALKAGIFLRELEFEFNSDVNLYPSSPKPDGMNDELYTAFFILNHNQKQIQTQISVITGDMSGGCQGSSSFKAYRITDYSWKNVLNYRKAADLFHSRGIMVNENVRDDVKDEYIIRTLGQLPLKNPESDLKVYEVLAPMSSDDDKLWNYVNFWNQAESLMENGEKEKALAMFIKLSEGRPSDKTARYFIKLLNDVN